MEPGYYNLAYNDYVPHDLVHKIPKRFLPDDFDLKKLDATTHAFASHNRVPVTPPFPVAVGVNVGLLFEPELPSPLDFNVSFNPKFPRIPCFEGERFATYMDETGGKLSTRSDSKSIDCYFLCEVDRSDEGETD